MHFAGSLAIYPLLCQARRSHMVTPFAFPPTGPSLLLWMPSPLSTPPLTVANPPQLLSQFQLVQPLLQSSVPMRFLIVVPMAASSIPRILVPSPPLAVM